MRPKTLAYFMGESSDELIKHLKNHGWSIGEVGSDGSWVTFAEKDGLRFEGCAPCHDQAWQDLLLKLMLAGKFSRN
jgi:hypothetical protein